MIYVVFGAPKEGKTFFVVYKILKTLGRGKRKVFTNFPVIHKGKTTYIWTPDMVDLPIYDSDIVIDEGYMDYSSRNFKDFSMEKHMFFAMNGHNGLDIWVIAQDPARLDTIIREMVNMFYYVRKTSWPLTDKAIFFTIEGYLTENALANRYTSDKAVYVRQHLLARRYIKNAYDYHFFRKPDTVKPVFKQWPIPGEQDKDILYNMTQDEILEFNAGNVDLGEDGDLDLELQIPVSEIHQ